MPRFRFISPASLAVFVCLICPNYLPAQDSVTIAGNLPHPLGPPVNSGNPAICDEINNRQITLTYGSSGIQAENDTVVNWRNVAPCGN